MKKNRYVALARVSNRKGHPLDAQEEDLDRWAGNNDGEIVMLFRVAETASHETWRAVFQDVFQFVKDNYVNLDGLVFYTVARAKRSLQYFAESGHIERQLAFAGLRCPIRRIRRRSWWPRPDARRPEERMTARQHSGAKGHPLDGQEEEPKRPERTTTTVGSAGINATPA
jgi:hypothetical protein